MSNKTRCNRFVLLLYKREKIHKHTFEHKILRDSNCRQERENVCNPG